MAHFAATVEQDVPETVWKERIPGNNTDILTSNLIKPALDAVKEVVRSLPEAYKVEKRRVKANMKRLEDTFKFIHHQRMSQMQSDQRHMQFQKQQAALIESLGKTLIKLLEDLSEQVIRLQAASARPSPTVDPSATPVTMANIEATVSNAIRRKVYISEEGARDLKELFAMFRYENIPIPLQLRNVAGEVCNDDQLRWVMDQE